MNIPVKRLTIESLGKNLAQKEDPNAEVMGGGVVRKETRSRYTDLGKENHKQ